jgi:hypothetical protein
MQAQIELNTITTTTSAVERNRRHLYEQNRRIAAAQCFFTLAQFGSFCYVKTEKAEI